MWFAWDFFEKLFEMKLKKQSLRKKSVSPKSDTLDDFHDDEFGSNGQWSG